MNLANCRCVKIYSNPTRRRVDSIGREIRNRPTQRESGREFCEKSDKMGVWNIGI